MKRNTRAATAEALAKVLYDYREGDVGRPSSKHIEMWLSQFEESEAKKDVILSELHHVLEQTYVPRKQALKFLSGLIKPNKLAGENPCDFWRSANLLRIQKRGNSQNEMLELFVAELKSRCQIDDNCGSKEGPLIYLDDALFSGNRIVDDFRAWMPNAPTPAVVHIVVMAVHTAGEFNVKKQVQGLCADHGKRINVNIWRLETFENRSNAGPAADMLRLKKFPEDEQSKAFIEEYGQGKGPALLRPGDAQSTSQFYSSEENRDLLERMFWKWGLEVRRRCPNLKVTHRPLGYTSTNSANKLGFGSIFVSFRNCPNNCPLVLWAGDPWYPLLPRKTNE
jgi:hypothetical protein